MNEPYPSIDPPMQRAGYGQELYSITRGVHLRFRREIRNIIYTYMLTQEDFASLIRQCRGPSDKSYDDHKDFVTSVMEPPDLSQHLQLSVITLSYPPFAAEVADMVYEIYPYFMINTPSKISEFLNTDFFGTKRAPRDARLSALHIRGSLDEGHCNSVNVDTLASDFGALSDCNWTPNFNLSINFRTDVGFSILDARAIPGVARRMYAIWQILRPWIAEAEKRGARVCLTLLTRAGEGSREVTGESSRDTNIYMANITCSTARQSGYKS